MKNVVSILAFLLLVGFMILKIGSRLNRASSHLGESEKNKEIIITQNKLKGISTKLRSETWFGINNINGTDYFEEIQFFSHNLGNRKIFLGNEGIQDCSIKQQFKWNIMSGSSRAKNSFNIVFYLDKQLKNIGCNELQKQQIDKISPELMKNHKIKLDSKNGIDIDLIYA